MPLAAPSPKGLTACLIAVLVMLAVLVGPAMASGADEAATASASSKPAAASAKTRASGSKLRFRARREGAPGRCKSRAQRVRARQARRALARRTKARVANPAKRCRPGRRKASRPAPQPGAKGRPRVGACSAGACAGAVESSDSVSGVSAAHLRVGLVANTQIHDHKAGLEQDIAKQTGAGWLREELDWDVIEPQNDQWSWTRYDTVMEQAALRGMRILPLLNGSASWAAPRWNQFPDDPADYAQYVAKVTERYGPGGTFWEARPQLASYAPTHFELWNEPYIEYFSIDKVSPGRYARLAAAGAAAGRAANPQAKFLLSADTFYTEGPGDYRNWIDGMYAAVPDLNSHFDAVAIHPYSAGLSPDAYTPGRGTRWQFRRIEEMRARFVAHGAADKRFWITELGWATCTGHEDCVTEQQQAENVARVFAYAKREYASFMEAVFIYHMNDWGPADQTNKEYWFGLRRKDGSPKPAFEVLRRAAGVA